MALYCAIAADRVRLGAEVTKVTDLPDRVEVVYKDKQGKEVLVTADFCVAALPPPKPLSDSPMLLGGCETVTTRCE
jgi:monoamine oxidase